MFLYQTPNGSWFGTEANWKAATIAEGHDPKVWRDKAKLEVPTDKPGLMDFLTFNHVNVINPPDRSAPAEAPAQYLEPQESGPSVMDPPRTTVPDLDTLFEQAPIHQKLRLAVSAIDAADAALPRPQ